MENCQCSNQPPKLKRQRISVVRDFPPGCGPFSDLNYLRPVKASESEPLECLVTGSKNVDLKGVEKQLPNARIDEMDSMTAKDVGNVEAVESETALDHEISYLPKSLNLLNDLRPDEEVTCVGVTEGLIARDANGDGQIEKLILSAGHPGDMDSINSKVVGIGDMIESIAALEHEVAGLPKNLYHLNHLKSVDELASVGTAEHLIRKDNNYDGQVIEMMRVSNSQLDETELMNGKDVGAVDMVKSVTTFQHEISDFLENPCKLGAVTTKEEMVADLSNPNFSSPPDGSVSISNGSGPEKTAANKCRCRRIVSAVRDFPPLCGRNAEAWNFGQEEYSSGT